jgi:(p)ppGpp synthase/HD superfamily hydrolase
MDSKTRQRIRGIYQRMAAEEKLALERALLMKKKDRFGLIADIAGLSDEEQEILFNASQFTQEDVDDMIAYAARGFIMRLLGRIFGF